MDVIITRTERTDGGTRSRIDWLGESFHGLEPPWLDNVPFQSCIPTGLYTILPHDSPRHGECYAFFGGTVGLHEDEKGYAERFACLIHPANYAAQLEGCLAPGLSAGQHEGKPAVWYSRAALGKMQRQAEGRSFLHCRIEWGHATD